MKTDIHKLCDYSISQALPFKLGVVKTFTFDVFFFNIAGIKYTICYLFYICFIFGSTFLKMPWDSILISLLGDYTLFFSGCLF